MGDRILKEYPYRARVAPMLLAGFFFSFCSVVLFYAAQRAADRGIRIMGVSLEGESGRYLLYVLTVFSACFVLAAIAVLIDRMKNTRRIAFTDEAILVPIRRFATGERVVKLNTITDVTVTDTYGQRFISFKHPEGKFSVVASMLPDDASFDEIVQQLARHAGKGTGWSGLTRHER